MTEPRKDEEVKNLLGLKMDDESDGVSYLQDYLTQRGFLNNEQRNRHYDPEIHKDSEPLKEGVFDLKTRFALEEFQGSFGLQVTGDVTDETLELISTPYATMPNIAVKDRWRKYDLTYSFDTSPEGTNPEDIAPIYRQAFDLWSEHTLFRFTRVQGNSDILARFHKREGGFVGHSFRPNEYAHSYYPLPFNYRKGQAHFNLLLNWTFDLSGGIDLLTAAAQQFGGALGLGASNVPGSLMYPYYSGPHRFLSPNDIERIKYLYDPTTRRYWQQLPGKATDIGVGANGDVWIIGTNLVNLVGGFGIWRLNNNDTWTPVDGYGKRIAVAPNGDPWMVNGFNEIYRRSGNVWNRMPGAAIDIGIGVNGHVWVVGTNQTGQGGFGIHKWNGNNWDPVGAGAIRIAVDQNGVPWTVNSMRQIHRRDGNGWTLMPGGAVDIGIGGEGAVWIAGTDGALYKWRGDGWYDVEAWINNVSVSPRGHPWATNPDGGIFRRIN